MLKRRDFALLAAASPLAFAGSAAYAATPKDILVVAKDISDILTMDPQECYEITGGEVVIAVYDSILRYEPKDVTKIIGGTAQTWLRMQSNHDLARALKAEGKIRVRRYRPKEVAA